ncbi:hypothetical protein JHN59_29740 [Streptomyces sp. MBT49]|uniref:hypothetical protein n=1 Tax=Streptomyces sp. MBT49 TaxID=1488380 RepID=UPI00190A224E|nr:hypothetical protein [Streptomyces sp. MBT49]MBK3628935.1 hypothetical protein [Streptomyces sp. MBT49]
MCTAWDDIARNATESLVDGTAVLAHGRITEIKDTTICLSIHDLGLSLRHRIAYTEAGLSGAHTPTPPSSPHHWWEKQPTHHEPGPANAPTTGTSLLHTSS